MKYLRMTVWLGRKAAPMTSITSERDLPGSVYAAATRQRTLEKQFDGPPVEIEVHDLPDALSPQEAAIEIIKARPAPLSPEQRNQHTLFDWAMDLLDVLKPGGTAQTTVPSPLDITTLTKVLYQIAAAPTYAQQTFNMFLPDYTQVSLVRGKVVTSKPT